MNITQRISPAVLRFVEYLYIYMSDRYHSCGVCWHIYIYQAFVQLPHQKKLMKTNAVYTPGLFLVCVPYMVCLLGVVTSPEKLVMVS